MTVPVMVYLNEEGEYWVAIADEPSEKEAWIRAEFSTGAHMIPDGRVVVPLVECDYGHSCDSRNDCEAHDTCPCPEIEDTEAWSFLDVSEDDDRRKYLAYEWDVVYVSPTPL